MVDDHDQSRKCVRYEREYHVKRILLTADPVLNPEKCVVVAIYNFDGYLAFIRYAKETTWTKVKFSVFFEDAVCYKNCIYAVTLSNMLVCFDIPEAGPIDGITILTPELNGNCGWIRRYLVKTPNGNLLQVVRHKVYDDFTFWTEKFDVRRLDASDRSWTKLKSIGDMAIFLGDNDSVLFRASDFYGCQSDSIYFTQDKDYIGSIHHFGDLGVYKIERGKFNYSHFNIDWSILNRMPKRPIWLLPINTH